LDPGRAEIAVPAKRRSNNRYDAECRHGFFGLEFSKMKTATFLWLFTIFLHGQRLSCRGLIGVTGTVDGIGSRCLPFSALRNACEMQFCVEAHSRACGVCKKQAETGALSARFRGVGNDLLY
jgi:hypothetical protein